MNNPSPYSQQVTAQAIDTLYRGLPKLFGTALMPIITIWVFWAKIDHVILIWWGVFIMAASAYTQILFVTFTKHTPALADFPRWGRYLTWAMLANGMTWGVAGIMFFVPESAPHQVFLFVCIIGLSTGAISLLSYTFESYCAFAIPPMTLTAVSLFTRGGFEYQSLAALVIIALAVLLLIARHVNQAMLESIRLRFSNLDLLEQLRQEKNKFEIANRDKTRFLAAASHDLRQPVHALAMFTNALNSDLAIIAKPSTITLLKHIENSIAALNQLLGSLLDISKLDANIVLPHRLQFNVSSVLERLHAEYAPQALAKGLTFKTGHQNEIINSDPVLFENILRNLISNALRYTQTGCVNVIASRQKSSVQIEVRDTGIGIPKTQQQEIFREFFQLSNPERDRSQGLGLGLAIVERLATLLNHRILLESEPGKGSCFTLVIQGNNISMEKNNNDVFDGEATETREAPSPYLELANFSFNGMKILVIDDEIAIRQGMAAMLDNWGCATILADSAEQAIQQIAMLQKSDQQLPQIIITDYRLREGKTGAQAVDQIRQLIGQQIPALIITGDTDPVRLREAQASGHTLMHKPIQPAKLRVFLQHIRRKILPSIDRPH